MSFTLHSGKKQLWTRRGAAILALIVIATFVITMVVPVEYVPFGGRYDKVKHALFFVVITLSLKSYLRTNIWILGACLAVFAAVSEWVQHLIPHRSGNVDDLYADWIGIAFTCIIWQLGDWFFKLVKKVKR